MIGVGVLLMPQWKLILLSFEMMCVIWTISVYGCVRFLIGFYEVFWEVSVKFGFMDSLQINGGAIFPQGQICLRFLIN